MSGSAGASGSSATGNNETAGFPPPGVSNPDGGGDSNIEESGGDDSSAATSPPGNDPSTGQSRAPEISPPPPPPEASPPPALKQQSPPPPEKQSPPPPEQQSPPPPEEQSPPPPNEQPPPPPKQQTPPSSPPNNPSQNSSPPPPPDKPTSPTLSPPPPASSGTPQAPPPPIPEISPSKPSPALSPPPPTSVSPKALAPPPPLQSKASKTQSNSTSGSSSSGTSTDSLETNYRVAIGAGAAASVLILALVALVFCLRRKKKRRQPHYLNYVPPSPPIFPGTAGKNDVYVPMEFSGLNGYNSGVHNHQHSGGYSSGSQTRNSYHGSDSDIIASKRAFFSYEELMEMTNGFSRQNVIGEGGFGCVYKGFLPDGKPVAVKQLKVGSGQGDREFKAEVEIISRVHHKHLVSLVGYCIAENQRLLIYEFVPNKTLEHHLHAKHLPVLDWAKRVKIAEGAAKGLAYLHEDCHPKIIHRDIKSANILLEDDFEAQVADFGLAKLNDTTQTHVSTRVMGTFGYLAPEYASSGKLTDRSDVFSFGVVLLELITGRRPVDATQPLGDESLVEWARPLLINAIETGKFDELVDPRLENHYAEVQMLRMIEAAAACVRHSAAKRPRMVQVARALDFQGDADLSNGVKFGQSTVYNSSQYSEEIMKFRRIALGSDQSSEFNTNSGEYSSRQSCKGRRNSRKSPYNSTDFSSKESETQAFNLPSGEYSTDASGNYDHHRFRK